MSRHCTNLIEIWIWMKPFRETSYSYKWCQCSFPIDIFKSNSRVFQYTNIPQSAFQEQEMICLGTELILYAVALLITLRSTCCRLLWHALMTNWLNLKSACSSQCWWFIQYITCSFARLVRFISHHWSALLTSLIYSTTWFMQSFFRLIFQGRKLWFREAFEL